MTREYEDWIDTKLINRRMLKARKNHLCICGKEIRRGEKYCREFWLVDGEVSILKHGNHIHIGEY